MHGPRKAKDTAWKSYSHQLHLAVSQAEDVLMQELKHLHESICGDPSTQRFLQLPRHCQVSPAELHHGRFHPAPTWALTVNFIAAVRDLERLRILRSSEDLCDLMRLGRLCQKGTCARRTWVGRLPSDIFANRRRLSGSCCCRKSSSKLDFWMGLVALWLFALHDYLAPVFLRKVQSVVTERELQLPEARAFEWVLARARTHIKDRGLKSWEEKVLAPLWVIDVLACRCEVASAERALAVEKALTMEFELVSKESSHTPGESQAGCGVLHRKLILLLQADFTQLGHVNALVEVKIFLNPYASIDRRMQLVRYARTGSCE